MRLSRLLVPLLVFFVAAGCGRPDYSNAIRITMFSEIEMQKILVARFQHFEKETGIAVKPIFVPYANYHEKLLAQMASGTTPDVVSIETDLFTGLADTGALISLNQYVERDGLSLEGFYPRLVDYFTHQEQLLAVPNDIAPIACLFYNKDMFDKAGLAYPDKDWTWKNLLHAAKKMSRVEGKLTDIYGFKNNYGPDWGCMIYANGGRMLDDLDKPTRCLLDSPEAIEAVQFLSDLANVHHVTPAESEKNTMVSLGQDLFISGRLAMVHSGLWTNISLRQIKDFRWDMAPLPRGPSAKEPGWSTGGTGFAISRDSKMPDKAWLLVKYLASAETQKFFARVGSAQPAIKAVAASPVFLESPPMINRKFLVEAPRYSVYEPRIKVWNEWTRSIIEPEMAEVMRGQEKAAPAMKRIAKRVNAELAKMNKK